MRLGEFIEAVESYGVSVKALMTGRGNAQWFDEMLDRDPIGTGNYRSYTTQQVRRLAAWFLIGAVTGHGSRGNQHIRYPGYEQRRQAMRLMAAASEGWVVMAAGRAWWSLTEPIGIIRSNLCPVVIPVPQWKH